MERVLRESDDGVVVYVAPSKALVNQVAAEAFARFSKEVAGQSLWAIHTGDYRINNPQNCQILVTVSCKSWAGSESVSADPFAFLRSRMCSLRCF